MIDYFQVSPHIPVLWNHAQSEYVDSKNATLNLETTNICNLRCMFCPHHLMKRRQGVMQESLFRKIIDEATAIGFRKAILSGCGEPLCDKYIVERIAYIKQHNINDIDLTTNGYLLTDSLLTKLFQAGLTRLHLSLAPFREYQLTRPGTDAERVFDMVRSLKNNPYLNNIEINYLDAGIATLTEQKEFFDFLNKSHFHLISQMNKFNWSRSGDTSFLRAREPYRPTPCLCWALWMPSITWDGLCIRCCIDAEAETVIGDLNTHNLSNILNCETIREIRRNHLNGKFMKYCLACNVPMSVEDRDKTELLSLKYLWRCANIYLFHSKSIIGYKPSLYDGLRLLLNKYRKYLLSWLSRRYCGR